MKQMCQWQGQAFPGSKELSSSGPLGGLERGAGKKRDLGNKIVPRFQGGWVGISNVTVPINVKLD